MLVRQEKVNPKVIGLKRVPLLFCHLFAHQLALLPLIRPPSPHPSHLFSSFHFLNSIHGGVSQGAWGRLPCCHRNNLQPWPWAGVRGQGEVTAEAMIMVKGGGWGVAIRSEGLRLDII